VSKDADYSKGLSRGWVMVRLGDVAVIQSGLTKNAKKQDAAFREVPYLRVANVQRGWLDLSEIKTIAATENQIQQTLLRPGDVLFNEGGDRDKVGRGWVWNGEIAECVHQNHVFRARMQPEIHPKYISYYGNSWGADYFLASGKQTTNLASLNQQMLKNLPIRLAPLPEQHRIVAEIEKHLTRLDDAVATLKRVETELERARASVLKAAVEGRLVPTEAALARAEGRTYEPAGVLLDRILTERKRKHEEAHGKKKYKPPVEPESEGLPELPEGWVWSSVEQTTEFVTSGSRGWAEYYAETGAIFIRSQDINTYRLDLSSVAYVKLPTGAEGTRTRVQKGDLLIIITGANVTISAFIQADVEEGYVSQHVGLCRPVDIAVSPYLHLWLMAYGGGRSQLEDAAYGAGKPGLNLMNIRDVRVGIPPLAEQLRIIAEVSRRLSVFDALAATVTRNLTRCAHLRQSILKRAFSGKLVPQDPTDEPASALVVRIQSQSS
jgi:type I restriction enzyme, S subunit